MFTRPSGAPPPVSRRLAMTDPASDTSPTPDPGTATAVPPSRVADLRLAVALLTRIPVALAGAADNHRAMQAAWAYPLVGAAIGLLSGGVYTLALALAIPALPAAVLALTAAAWCSGALHEDGLADSADGLFGGRTSARRLEIMRDSRIGSYGTLALVLSVALRVGAIAALDAWTALPALVAAHAGARWAMLLPAAAAGPARPDGLASAMSRGGSRPKPWRIVISPWPTLMLTTVPATILIGLTSGMVPAATGVLAGLLVATALAIVLGRLARRAIGGYTGDILGAAEQLAEAALLVAFAAALAP